MVVEEEGSMPWTFKAIHCPYLYMSTWPIYIFSPHFNVFYVSNDCIYKGSSIIIQKKSTTIKKEIETKIES